MVWFLDKNKKGTERENKVLFIDAREIYRQIDRSHRDFSEEQLELISNIVRLYRGQELVFDNGSSKLIESIFGTHVYRNIPGLCSVATISDIEKEEWSLNPSRYIEAKKRQKESIDYNSRMRELNNELIELNFKGQELEKVMQNNFSNLLE